MNVSHITIPFDKLESILGLPDSSRIVAAREHDNGRFVVVRVVGETLPRDFVLEANDPLSKIGEAYKPLPVPPIEPEFT